MLNKRQQILCQNLSSDKNKEILIYFALELEIPITENITKAKLCGLISRYIVYGKGKKDFYKIEKQNEKIKEQIRAAAQRFGLNPDDPIDQLLNDLGKMLI